MARFVVGKNDEGFIHVNLEAEAGDELTPEQATAWASLQIAAELDYIGMQVNGVAGQVSDLVNRMP